MWTRFMDMHSGGGRKLQWSSIMIEAPEAEAIEVFRNRFGRDPLKITCHCCGEDYSVSEYETLEEATAFGRGCKPTKGEGWVEEWCGRVYRPYLTLDEHLAQGDVLVIRADEIGV